MNDVFTIFENMTEMLKRLKKDSYITKFEIFFDKNSDFFKSILTDIESSENPETKANELSTSFIDAVIELFKNKRNKIPSAKQMDINLFMIYYVFPTILKIDSPHKDLFADTLCKAWCVAFKNNNFTYTTYETISEGFPKSILGIPLK